MYLMFKREPGPGALWADSCPHGHPPLPGSLRLPGGGPMADQKGLRSQSIHDKTARGCPCGDALQRWIRKQLYLF